MMKRFLYTLVAIAILVGNGCRISPKQGILASGQTDELHAQVESILLHLHSNTNVAVEAQAHRKLDALGEQAGTQALADAIKATVTSNRFLIKGNAIFVIATHISEPDYFAFITPTEEECTSAHMALWSGHPAKAIRMLEESPELISSLDDNEETPLHVAANHGCINVVRWLLDHGADPNAEAYSKFLPIQLTTNGAIARMLIEAGTDLDHRDNWGNTPLQKAAHMRETEIVDAIIASGHPVDLRSALWLKDRERVKMILAKTARIPPEDENQSDLWGDVSPLGLAAQQGDMELVQLLLQAGADPKAKTERPNLNAYSSPLCVAVWGAHTNIVKVLLEKGADPNILIEYRWNKWNLLDGAKKLGNPEIIRILKEHGAVRFEEDPQRK